MSGARRLVVCASLLCALAGRAGAQTAVPGQTVVLDWGLDPRTISAMPGGAAHDGRLAHALPTRPPVTLRLIGGERARPRGPVVDAESRIYVGTATGVSIFSASGEALAEVSLGLVEASPILVPGGAVVAVGRSGAIARVAPDGTVVASRSTDLGVRFAPLGLGDGSFLVVGAGRTLSRFGPDLEERFRVDLPDGFALSATLAASGRIAVASGSELVLVEGDGRLVRSIALPGRAVTPPARAADGALWIATTDGLLVQIAHELRVRRTVSLGARVLDGTTLGIAPSGDVLVSLSTRGVVAVAPSGEERWVASVDAPFYGHLAVDPSGRVAVVDRLGRLTVLSPDGAVEWTVPVGGVPLSAVVALPDGRLVLATDHGVAILG